VLAKVSFLNAVNSLRDHYREQFKSYFDVYPVIEQDQDTHFNWAIEKFGLKQASSLISAYFAIDDDWIKKQAYPMGIFKKQINKVIASGVKNRRVKMPSYVVAITESGERVTSTIKDVGKVISTCEGRPSLINELEPSLISE